MKRIVVFTGAGISAESGIQTFRDKDGLWNNHRIEDVATPGAFMRDPELVMDFYNQRRRQLLEVHPNDAHLALVKLETTFDVRIITQNVDDLHERAGSTHVMHLHGEIRKARSTGDPDYIVPIEGWELKMGDLCPKGYQLRPHIVWFGEEVPMIGPAARLTASADIFIIIGSSLQVYPAAGLVFEAPHKAPKYLIDPKAGHQDYVNNLTIIRTTATQGVPALVDQLMQESQD